MCKHVTTIHKLYMYVCPGEYACDVRIPDSSVQTCRTCSCTCHVHLIEKVPGTCTLQCEVLIILVNFRVEYVIITFQLGDNIVV